MSNILQLSKEIEKPEATSFSWPFEVDPVNSFAYWEGAFSKEECELIILLGTAHKKTKATTRSAAKQNIRESEVAWILPNNETDWIFRRITDVVMSLNNNFFKFDLFGLTEGLQFTKYSVPGGKYGKHVDSAPNTPVRKLSFSLQLSDPEDYKGGELELHFSDTPDVMKKEQGTAILFPSYTLHEVKKVTEGTRYSLVAWVTGKPFK